MFVFRTAVVGAGTMGGEIAHTIAAAGLPVALRDVDPSALDTGVARARSLWQAQLDAGKLTEAELEQRLELITPTTAYDGFDQVDFVIEAVPEQPELKAAVFRELDAVVPGHAILASNTSSLPITPLGDATTRPERVVGFHFFYPAATARLIEVVEGEETSPETIAAAVSFAQTIRKMPIRCVEGPGFVVNRILSAAVSEVWRYQEEMGLEPAAVDRLITAPGGAPVGPFHLADLLGLDTVLHVAEYLNEALGDRFYVHTGLRELVARGDLGAKTGRGFHERR